MREKVSRLYEQDADDIRIETHLHRWWQGVRGGVDGVLKMIVVLRAGFLRYALATARYKISDL